MVDVELAEVTDLQVSSPILAFCRGLALPAVVFPKFTLLQANLSELHSNLWQASEMTDQEAEEVERKENLLKIKMAQASDKVREWGMQTGLERLLHSEMHGAKWHDDKKKPVNEVRVVLKLLPVAVLFMACVLGASTVHFDDSVPIPGNLYSLAAGHPIIFPMRHSESMVEARVQIMSSAASGITMGSEDESGGHGGHRRSARRYSTAPFARRSDSAEANGNTSGIETANTGGEMHSTPDFAAPGGNVSFYLVIMKPGDERWKHGDFSFGSFKELAVREPELISRHQLQQQEQALLLEFEIEENADDEFFLVVSDSPDPLAVAISMHSLGSLGPLQVIIAGVIMSIVFGLIMTEVLHRTMAAMIGAAMCMIVLAAENRVPTLAKVVSWMDHGTLGLLWGMMLIVGITMRTGVFEWTGVMACKLSGGNKTRLLLLLCIVTAVLSAFLDNVTTILLICPVTCKLCKLVNIDPRPFLICEAIFSNLGGTATMIGDPPNIIIGNLLNEYLDFNAFLFNLGPGVLVTCPFIFYYLVWYFGAPVKGHLEVDIPKLQKMYPITDRGLLIKCGTVLTCVIISFFLHPVTHLDPAWVAIMGAVWLLVAFDMHHCHEALLAVEWDTLLFFAALFVVVEGVGELGLLRFIANTLSGMVETVPVEGRQYFAIFLICWASAVFSAFVDNIPFTATMVPVMVQMVERVEGLSIEPLAWALAFGACFGGNGTLIGASANIVMASKAEVEGYRISFIEFFKIGFPVMIISVAIVTVYLMILNAIFWQASAGN
jgi:Na+/H+ antiporter NhaD/arsenite permease-like protein